MCVRGKEGARHNFVILGTRPTLQKILFDSPENAIFCALDCKSTNLRWISSPNFSLSRRFIEDGEGRSTVERPAEVVSRNVEMAPVCGRLPLPFAGEDAEREISMRIVEH